MKIIKFLRSFENKVFPVRPENGLQGTGSDNELSFTVQEVAYVQRVLEKFNQLVELGDAFKQEKNIDSISRVHPALATNLAATLQRNSYVDFFEKTKSLIIDIGNFPQSSGGPAFGTDFISFETWARSDSCKLKRRPQNLDKYQSFINLVCLSSDVLSNPTDSLANENLHLDMVILAQVALRETGWNEPASLARMKTSASVIIKQMRSMIAVVIPGVFPPDCLPGA